MDKETLPVYFMNMVLSLTASGMQLLGKVANPADGKITKDLKQARLIIEMLEMLKEKTRGNLSKQEEELLSNAVADLQLNYADEALRQATAPADAAAKETKPSGDAKQ